MKMQDPDDVMTNRRKPDILNCHEKIVRLLSQFQSNIRGKQNTETCSGDIHLSGDIHH